MIVSMLIGFGGNELLTEKQIQNTYICPLTEEVGVFDRLSGSEKTGYSLVNGIEEGFPCRIGRDYEPWIPLLEYAESQGVDISELIQKDTIKKDTSMVKCKQSGCEI